MEKRSGGWRPILNLKELNVAVKPPSFKMDTLQSVLVSLGEDIRLSQSANTLGSGQDMWAVSLDLEDAYFHVAIDPRDRKYLRFAYDGNRLRVPSLAVRPFYGPKNVHTSGTGPWALTSRHAESICSNIWTIGS